MGTVLVPLRLFRYVPGGTSTYNTITVEVEETASVLDALDLAWATQHRTINYRRACHHSSCGACALRINGEEKLPCITPIMEVWDGSKPVRLDPLRNFPLVSDLVVDMHGFFQRLSASALHMTRVAEDVLPVSVDPMGEELAPVAVEEPEQPPDLNRFESCIECGICMSACPTMATDDKFLGPAGLAAIYRAVQSTDDEQIRTHLLALANGEHGVWRCHSAFECTETCPQAVDPAGKIMALRRELMSQRVGLRKRRT